MAAKQQRNSGRVAGRRNRSRSRTNHVGKNQEGKHLKTTMISKWSEQRCFKPSLLYNNNE